jgi:BolA protein
MFEKSWMRIMSLGPVGQLITEKLRDAFEPSVLDVSDDSHKHKGHSGARPEGETHFRVHIVSPAFTGLTRIERHRAVNSVLADELAGPVHALAISAEAPAG